MSKLLIKEVWVDEFAPLLSKSNGQLKILHIIRDPRSVVASNFKSDNKYPLLFWFGNGEKKL